LLKLVLVILFVEKLMIPNELITVYTRSTIATTFIQNNHA
jgi:hypothetical protein